VDALITEQADAIDAVKNAAPALTASVEAAVVRLRTGGRLAYVGAGTSGRLAETDASELAPTFGFDRAIILVPARGTPPFTATETEDHRNRGSSRVRGLRLGPSDVVIGVAASGTTPFVVGALEAARLAGALTIALVSNPNSTLGQMADQCVLLLTGAEPIAGSTRMKAGLAQKLALTTFSTAVMIQLGRTYDNLMVEIPAAPAKLAARRTRVVMEACGIDSNAARALLAESGDDVKIAIVRGLTGVAAATAADALISSGSIRSAMAALQQHAF
jgi:N-acetylmuramic acid 6-phosphate etherase